MKLLQTLLTFIAGTVLGAAGQSLFGITGMIVGSLVGIIVGWWGARRLLAGL